MRMQRVPPVSENGEKGSTKKPELPFPNVHKREERKKGKGNLLTASFTVRETNRKKKKKERDAGVQSRCYVFT